MPQTFRFLAPLLLAAAACGAHAGARAQGLSGAPQGSAAAAPAVAAQAQGEAR